VTTVLDLDRAADITLTGGTGVGFAVGAAGDLNGDGLADVVVGAPTATLGPPSAGIAYGVLGQEDGLLAPDLTRLDGTDGFAVAGTATDGRLGFAVSGVGDLNHDGLDDVAIGVPFATVGRTANAGAVYILYGNTGGFAPVIAEDSLQGSQGAVLTGVDLNSYAGIALSAAGDINGDGIDDVIIGASDADPNQRVDAGETYVVFGQAGGLPNPLDLGSLDGTNGFVITGEGAEDFSGRAVSAAGDVNGDGLDDIIVGALLNDTSALDAGTAYVVFGRSDPFPATLDLATLAPTEGWIITGAAADDRAGGAVGGGSDINGDGYDDVVVGAFKADAGAPDAGAVYVIYGGPEVGGTLALADLDSTTGLVLTGSETTQGAGIAVALPGDVNGDGFGDVLVGVQTVGSAGIAAYVVYGGPVLPAQLDLAQLGTGAGLGLQAAGGGGPFGTAVSGAGDLNGDGLADVLVGSAYSGTGTVYGLLGAPSEAGELRAVEDGIAIAGAPAGVLSVTVAAISPASFGLTLVLVPTATVAADGTPLPLDPNLDLDDVMVVSTLGDDDLIALGGGIPAPRHLAIAGDTAYTLAVVNTANPTAPIPVAVTITPTVDPMGSPQLTLQADLDADAQFDDLVLHLTLADRLPVGVALPGTAQAELIDLRGIPGDVVATVVLAGEAVRTNEVALYPVLDGNGTIHDEFGNRLQPGDAGYGAAAAAQAMPLADGDTLVLAGDTIYAPLLVVDGSLTAANDGDPTNDPTLYLAYPAANGDGTDHVVLLGNHTFGFEDWAGGGDWDYDDAVVQLQLEGG